MRLSSVVSLPWNDPVVWGTSLVLTLQSLYGPPWLRRTRIAFNHMRINHYV